ncbi:MAG: hypothetical protein EOP21_08560 [Hyphomicrobiales bacterium]|nr:MAG: hypothetical protein EOP21_08560 [Hyphomicrobiales bacterium]
MAPGARSPERGILMYYRLFASRSAVSQFSIVAAAFGILGSMPTAAMAQTESSSKLEAEEAGRPALEPVGARIGVFRAFVGGDLFAVYDDNVYARDSGGKVDDTYFRISPSLRLTADTSRYKWNVSAGLDRYEYSKQDSESRTDWNVRSDVIAELVRDTNVTLNGGYRRGTEERGAPDSPTTARSPVRYSSLTAGGGFSREVGRLQLRTIVDYEKLDFKDGRQGNNTIINNDDRDRQTVEAGGEMSYEFSPGYRMFGRAVYERVAYRIARDDAGFNRDNRGYRLTGGLKFELTNVVDGNIFVGYMHRSYKDPRFRDYSGAAYGASIRWSPTRLTTISIDANRSVQETTQLGFRGYISSNFGVRIEHDLTRYIQLNGGLRYDKNNYLVVAGFVPAPIDRDDDLLIANLGAKYTLNRQIAFGVAWDYTKRNSNQPASDYTRNKISALARFTF